jgi:predicted nucleotidyltransferase
VSERETLLAKELARYVGVLSRDQDVDRVILFGSLASGSVGSGSDIDLLVAKRTTLPFLKRLREVRRTLQPHLATDILVYTPEEFENLATDRPFVREEIVRRGKVLCERCR